MNFKDRLIRAQGGDRQAEQEILGMYKPLLVKESIINGVLINQLAAPTLRIIEISSIRA